MIDQQEYYTDSIIVPHKHFRLRIGNVIVGFMQERTSGSLYYSKDNFWWSTNQIVHESKDRSSEMFDANRQMIFEHDIVKIKKYKETDYTKRGWVIWENEKKKLMIKAFEEDALFPVESVNKDSPFRDDLKVISQLYSPTS